MAKRANMASRILLFCGLTFLCLAVVEYFIIVLAGPNVFTLPTIEKEAQILRLVILSAPIPLAAASFLGSIAAKLNNW